MASRIALGVLVLAALAVLLALGTWQVQRHEWKQRMVAAIDTRTDAPPLEARAALSLPPGEVDFRRVVLTGEPLWDDVMVVANRVRQATRGEELVLPVRVQAGAPAVLVNLGWVPDGHREAVLRDLASRPPGTLEGLARDPDGRTATRIPSGAWTALAPASMAATLPYAVADWYVIAGSELQRPPGLGSALPVQGWQRFQNTTPHLEYAATWYGIAVVLVGVVIARFVIAPRRARSLRSSALSPSAGESGE